MKIIRKGNTNYTKLDEMEKNACERVERLDEMIKKLREEIAELETKN